MAGLLIVPGLWPVFDANGDPVSGATINFYEPGTTTPKAVYSDDTLSTSLGTSLTTNAAGEPTTTLAGAVARLWWAADAAEFDVQVTAGASTRTWAGVYVTTSEAIYDPPAPAIPRTVGSRLADYISLKDYGAASNNTTDCATAIGNAVADALSRRKKLLIPGGIYAVLSDIPEISVTNDAPLEIIGDGRDVATLRFGGTATRGIRYRSTTTTANLLPRLSIRGLTLASRKNAIDWGVDAEWATNADIEDPFFMENVAVQQWLNDAADSGSGFGYFKRLVRVSNARNSNIKDWRFFGDMDRPDIDKTSVGIQLDGECTSFRIQHGYMLEAQTAISASGGASEGLYCLNNDLIAVNTGVLFDPSGSLEPQFTWQGGTIAPYEFGLDIRDCRYFRVADSFILIKKGVNADQPSKDATAVKVSGSLSGWGVIDVEISKEFGHFSTDAKTSIGVDIQNGDGVDVRGSVHGFDPSDPFNTGVRFAAGVTRSKADIATRNVTTDYAFTVADGNTIIRRNAGEMQLMGGNDQYFTVIGQTASFLKLLDLGATTDRKNICFVNDAQNLAIRQVNDNGTTRRDALVIDDGGNVRPGTDNTQNLGSGSFRWATVFAGTGTINTSDQTEKSALRQLSAAEIAVGRGLLTKIGVFQWLSSIQEKGDDARLHVGVIAQEVEALFNEHGLDPWQYGAMCSDPLFEVDPDDPNGTKTRPVIDPDTGEQKVRLGVRTDQLLWLALGAMGASNV